MLGDKNSDKSSKSYGIRLEIRFDEAYSESYSVLVEAKNLKSLPIEYYEINWVFFSREKVLARDVPLKSAYIDSSSTTRNRNGSDIYIGKIIKELLSHEEQVDIAQSHRLMKEIFMDEPSVEAINKKITAASKISDKEVKISVELTARNAWESSLMTFLDNVPFHFIGKGEQSIIKTNLALAHKKAKEANVILIEEPENHLSHSKLNQLINTIKNSSEEKQVVITTHSSFVANKLGLNDLILLNEKNTLKLNELSDETQRFFEKISGYDTLRLLLSRKTILVEGDSDELVVQKAYSLNNNGKLPIEDGVEVISVGLSFLRFLEISEKLNIQTQVITDTDGDLDSIESKYESFLGDRKPDNIRINYDEVIDSGELVINGKSFNYNTLEPKLLKVNSLEVFNRVLGKDYSSLDEMHKYMKNNKTECALKIFESEEEVVFPNFILDAINE